MKQETKLRIQIKETENISNNAKDPSDRILAGYLLRELKAKLIDLLYPKPKEL